MKNVKRFICMLLCLVTVSTALALPSSAICRTNTSDSSYRGGFFYLLRERLLDAYKKLNIALPEKEEKTENSEKEEQKAEQREEQKADNAEEKIDVYEREVVRLVNAERAKYGLKALSYSKLLSDGAREKSADMQRNRYFSHTSPTYGSPFDQMKKMGITYRSAGENIAMGYKTAEAVVAAWMASEGHRANILSEKYTEIGVGYIAEGNYCTQWFRG